MAHDMTKVLMEVVIFMALIGSIGVAVAGVTNISGTALTLIGLVTLFVTIGFIKHLMKATK